jgi:hypothetical protein
MKLDSQTIVEILSQGESASDESQKAPRRGLQAATISFGKAGRGTIHRKAL